MLIAVKCPLCETKVDADSTSFGDSLPCPECQEEVEIPEAHVGEGVTLAGFQVKGTVGKGGMGVVYLANQLTMQRDVAIKVLPPNMTKNKDAVERFLKEARMSARLEHPNIVTILDAGEDTGFYYLAMRYVEGETLEDLLKRHRPLPEKDALKYMGQVVTALDFAWRHHKILHRDIKPSNIMIDEYGEVKLLDMGLAKDLLEESSITVTGTILGTPYYMSPEQAKGTEALDFHSDMYSVGATLFHLLTGRTPFEGDGAVSIMTKHLTDTPPNVKELNRGVSDVTAQLVARLLEKEKENRFETYGEVLDIINGILDDEDVIIPLTQRDLKKIPDLDALEGPEKATSPVSRTMFLAATLIGCCLITGAILIKIAHSSMKDGPQEGGDTPGIVSEQFPERIPPTPNGIPLGPDADSEIATQKQKELQETVRAQLSEINALAHTSENNLPQAIARCKQLGQIYASTAMAQEIAMTLKELESGYSVFRNTVFRDIQTRAWETYKGGDVQGAVDYLNTYDGPLTVETAVLRKNLIKRLMEDQQRQIREKKLAEERTQRRRQRQAQARRRAFEKILDEEAVKVAEALIRQDFEAALSRYNAFYNNPDHVAYKRDIAGAFQGLYELATMNDLIIESFRQDIGKPVTVSLKKKKIVLKIDGIRDGLVLAYREIVDGQTRGRIANNFTIFDLTVKERYNRLKGQELSENMKNVMKALLYLEIQQKTKASGELAQNDLPIARVLMLALNETVEQAVDRLLKVAGLPRDITTDAGKLKALFSTRDYTSEEMQRIQLEAGRFLKRFSGNAVADPYMPLARAMTKADIAYFLPKGMAAAQSLPIDVSLYGPGAEESVHLQGAFSVQTGLPTEVENSLGMRFRLVPPGASYQHLGKPPAGPYYIGKYEVTAKQWKQVMGECPFYRRDVLPVESITMAEAVQFLDKLCDREGVPQGTYRLPSSTEWGYACSAGIRSAYYFGDNVWDLGKFCNYLDRTAPNDYAGRALGMVKDMRHSDGHALTAAVGCYAPNPWGVYDMLGNVAEYVADGDLTYAIDRSEFKGGSWLHPARGVNPAHKGSLKGRVDPDQMKKIPMPFGFRVLRVIQKN